MMPADEAKLLDCDFIIASPLGMKMSAEREKSTDMLSSIELCVADGLDVMQMQNWDHVQVGHVQLHVTLLMSPPVHLRQPQQDPG